MAGSFSTEAIVLGAAPVHTAPTLGTAPANTPPATGTAPTGGAAAALNPWARTHAQVAGTDGGVDFELRANAEFPFLVSADLPHAIVSSISEGRP